MKRNLHGLALATALTLGLGLSSTAMADPQGIEGIVEITIEQVGIQSIDDVYSKVTAIDETITGTAGDVATTRKKIKKALGAADDLSLEKAIEEYKTKAPEMLQVTMKDGKPMIGFNPEAPEDVQKAAGALNDAMASLADAKTKLATIPGQMTDLTAKTAELANPAKLKDEAKAAGVKGKEVPGILKKVKGNNSSMKGVPTNAEAVVGEVDKTFELIKSIGG
jgi:hypothetical protein